LRIPTKGDGTVAATGWRIDVGGDVRGEASGVREEGEQGKTTEIG
jgi:hypothetical protein